MIKKLGTKELVAKLEKTSRKTKKAFWKNIAEILGKPTRNRVVVNVEKLDKLSEQFKGKTLVVPGKILSSGEINNKVSVVAESISERAEEKIKEAKGEFVLLKDFVDEKVKVDKLVIVK
jgi:large subunit ribosomal protein L18e